MKTAVVTGASAGVGLAIAERFAKEGWNVAIIARDAERLAMAQGQIARHARQVVAIAADASDVAAVEAAADQIVDAFGRIDVWVNNAMSTVVGAADQITPTEYERVTATTYLSTVHGTLAALRVMRAQNEGSIVQISSMLAIQAAPLQAAYCAAKSAVGGFTSSLRCELRAEGSPISLSVLYLPGMDTPQPEWARNHTGRSQVIPDPLFHPDLCARAVLSAVRHRHKEVWVGRSTIAMALAHAIAPGLTEKAAAKPKQQLGADEAPKVGNLDQPSPGPARILGQGRERTIETGPEFMSSRQWSLVKFGLAAAVAIGGGIAGTSLSRLMARARC